MEKMKHYQLASDIAGVPELFNKIVKLPGSKRTWECVGYSRTGNTVKFARLVDGGHLKDGRPWPRQISVYVDPNTSVEIVQGENDG